MKSVVVTGASTGIGKAIAADLAKSGFRVFGSIRKKEDAEALSVELGDAFTPLLFDVTDNAAIGAARDRVEEALKGETLFGLVNNAGIAVNGPLLYLPPEEFRYQLEVNTIAVLEMIQAFGPLLGARRPLVERPGRIVNISSVGGRMVSPFLGAYSASKHALEAMSDAFRRELMIFGVDVIVVEPGAVATPIWDKAEETGPGPYADTAYGPILDRFRKYFLDRGRDGLPPERVARTVRRALTTANPKARYLVVPHKLTNWTIPRLMSDRMLDRVMASRLGLKRKD